MSPNSWIRDLVLGHIALELFGWISFLLSFLMWGFVSSLQPLYFCVWSLLQRKLFLILLFWCLTQNSCHHLLFFITDLLCVCCSAHQGFFLCQKPTKLNTHLFFNTKGSWTLYYIFTAKPNSFFLVCDWPHKIFFKNKIESGESEAHFDSFLAFLPQRVTPRTSGPKASVTAKELEHWFMLSDDSAVSPFHTNINLGFLPGMLLCWTGCSC